MDNDVMDDEDFGAMMAGLRDVAAYQNGARDGFVTHVPANVDVRSIRARSGQTQDAFARCYGFSVASVRDWEQGRRQPERAARILLAMIDHAPDTVQHVMRGI